MTSGSVGMRVFRCGTIATWLAGGLLLASTALAQPDAVVGNWRGTLQSADGTVSPVIITIGRSGGGFTGSTSGVGENSETPLKQVAVTDNKVSIEGVSESKLGLVRLAAELTVEGPRMRGVGTVGVDNQAVPVTFELNRRQRQDVAQKQVEQRAAYFTGRWKFEYLGGEFPPLSNGERSGVMTFSSPTASQFVTGTLEGETLGKPFTETVTIGVSPDTKAVVYRERRSDGVELVSLGNWTSPLAIVFQTSPLTSSGKSYQLRRVISVLSESAFDVTEEFAVDGGAYRKLGTAHYTRTN